MPEMSLRARHRIPAAALALIAGFLATPSRSFAQG
jgi:hypothetical protein